MHNHLAIIRQPYLGEILAGRKTVECRLGKMGFPPHGQLRAGDLIWFKLTSGPVLAVAEARSVRSFKDLKPGMIQRIRREWGERIRASRTFWAIGRHASTATLIWLDHVCPLRPFRVLKHDQRAWVVLAGPPVPDQPVVTSRDGLV